MKDTCAIVAFFALIVSYGFLRNTSSADDHYRPAVPEYTKSGNTFLSFRFEQKGDELVFAHVTTIQTEGELEKDDQSAVSPVYVIQLQDNLGKPLKDFYLSGPLFTKNAVHHRQKTVSFHFPALRQAFTRALLFRLNEKGAVEYITTAGCKHHR